MRLKYRPLGDSATREPAAPPYTWRRLWNDPGASGRPSSWAGSFRRQLFFGSATPPLETAHGSSARPTPHALPLAGGHCLARFAQCAMPVVARSPEDMQFLRWPP